MRTHNNFYFMLSYWDLVAKCRFDWKQFTRAWRNAEESCYHLFNIVLSLNHLFDWILNDPDIEQGTKLLCIRQFNPYNHEELQRARTQYSVYSHSSLVDATLSTNSQQRLIRQVCNRAKHSKHTPVLEHHTITLWLKAFGGGRIRLGRNRRLTYPQYYVADDHGEHINLQMCCKDLIDQWMRFARPWRLYARKSELPHVSHLPPWLIALAKETEIRGYGFWFDSIAADDEPFQSEGTKIDFYNECGWSDTVWFLTKGRQKAFSTAAKYSILGDMERMKAPRFLVTRFADLEWALLHGQPRVT